MKTSNFLASLAHRIAGPLKSSGFVKSDDDLFVRFKDGHEVNVIWIQKHSSEPKICVNLGIHYDFLPKLGTTELPDNCKIELPDCEIKVRLTPATSQNDYWWLVGNKAVDEIANLIEDRAEKFFDRYNVGGEIVRITPEDLEGDMPDILSPLTKVRASLILARLHEVNGDLSEAINFAKFGIKAAGMAVGPKKMLKEILKIAEQRQESTWDSHT